MLVAIGWLVLTAALSVSAQPGVPTAPADGVLTEPIRCWWRSSAGAVRVGETFDVLLTCAVLETGAITVVPDQSALEPAVAQLPPFEVLGGSRPSDLRTDDRRFFQYRYELRVIADDAFGQDVELAALDIAYRIRSRAPDGTAIEGRDLTYRMPPIPIHVLTLVPRELTDIRDAGGGSFADLEGRVLRGRLLQTLGGLFVLLGVMLATVAAVATVRRSGSAGERGRAARSPLSDGAILRGIARELESIRRERESQDWTSAMSGRALAALRIAAAFMLSGRVSQVEASPDGDCVDGQLRFRGGWLGQRLALVSGGQTPGDVHEALARRASRQGSRAERSRLESLAGALASLTATRYGREELLDAEALDQALETGADVARQLQREHRWPATLVRAVAGFVVTQRNRVWPR